MYFDAIECFNTTIAFVMHNFMDNFFNFLGGQYV